MASCCMPGRSLMALFTRTAKLDHRAHSTRCAWAMAVHHTVGISCQRNSGYRPSRVNICERLCSLSGTFLPWMKEVKYLGIYLVSSKRFKISIEHSRRSFYRAANAIFGRIRRIATEEVVLHLLLTKCVPILLYGLLNKENGLEFIRFCCQQILYEIVSY